MLMSMTGYGRAENKIGELDVAVELRAVNSRFLEFAMRLPRGYEVLEDLTRTYLQSILQRGRVTVTMNLGTEQVSPGVPSLDSELLRHYDQLGQQGLSVLGRENESLPLAELLRFPDVISYRNAGPDQHSFNERVMVLIKQAADQLQAMRLREGALLEKGINDQLGKVGSLVSSIRDNDQGRLRVMADKMRKKLADFALQSDVPLDESRIEQEVVLWSDKLDIEEELTRLAAHVQHFRELMESNGDSGKRLNFLLQEMNREANTIGSKANSTPIGHAVVELKNEIERIREQVQNIQ